MHSVLIGALRAIASLGTLAGVLWLRKRPTAAEQRRRALNYIREPDQFPALSPGPLVVETERFLDTDQQTDDGPFSYYYAGMYFTFTHGSRQAGGRVYDDTPDEFSIYLPPPQDLFPKARYAEPPYRDPFLAEIVAYVRKHGPERVQISMLCEQGYVPIEQDRIAEVPPQP